MFFFSGYSDENKFQDLLNYYKFRKSFLTNNCKISILKDTGERLDKSKFNNREIIELNEAIANINSALHYEKYSYTIYKLFDNAKNPKNDLFYIYIIAENNERGVFYELVNYQGEYIHNDVISYRKGFNVKGNKKLEHCVINFEEKITGKNESSQDCEKHILTFFPTEETFDKVKNLNLEMFQYASITGSLLNLYNACFYEVVFINNKQKKVKNKMTGEVFIVDKDFPERLLKAFNNKEELNTFIVNMLTKKKINYDRDTIKELNYYHNDIFGLDNLFKQFEK